MMDDKCVVLKFLDRKGLAEDVCQNCSILEGEAEEVIDYLRRRVSDSKTEGGE